MSDINQPITARRRLTIAVVCGGAGAIILCLFGQARYAPLAAWDIVAMLYAGVTLATVLRYNATDTRRHARRENPGRALADVLLVVTSLASLAAVGVLLVLASKAQGATKAADIALGLFSVIASWGVVHTIFLLKYARLYYTDPTGGINFNESSPPRYADFAYLAFTVGMTFQVSDTDLLTKQVRTTVLRHALLAYIFGTVIIATTINTLASLSG